MNAASLPSNILLISASLLCLFLIFYFYRITNSFNQIKEEIKKISLKLDPLLKSMTDLSEKINKISDGVKEPVDLVRSTVSDVKERINSILSFESKLRKGMEDPVFRLINALTAIVNGVEAFWKNYKK
ncbi:MAG: hypothetical protein CO128_00415 [Ignavibacteriales bacterium CG_4_9_14_3_um_filter_30_11]|nr:MAG: hypothetical protein CO128_00415 [Ignavibacteriales bacterium CG_4_9_14_3_um_filter_30_11]